MGCGIPPHPQPLSRVGEKGATFFDELQFFHSSLHEGTLLSSNVVPRALWMWKIPFLGGAARKSTSWDSCNSSLSCRDLDDKAGTDRNIVFHVNVALVIRNDATGDRQSQARTSSFGREIGQKQLFLVGRWNAVTRILDYHLDCLPMRIKATGQAELLL